MISYQTEGIDMPAIKKRETTAWIKAVAETYGKKVGEIAYIFCSDEKILEVNRQYLQHDYYTESYTAYCIFAASMTRGRENAKSWKPPKTKRWKCGKISCNSYFCKGLKT